MLCNTSFLLLLQSLVLLAAVYQKAVPLVTARYVLTQHLYANLAPVAVDMNALHIKFGKKIFFSGVTLPTTHSSLIE